MPKKRRRERYEAPGSEHTEDAEVIEIRSASGETVVFITVAGEAGAVLNEGGRIKERPDTMSTTADIGKVLYEEDD